jgi:hypothetical protein
MMGICALRDRPGLALQASVVHGSPEQLTHLNHKPASSRSLHHIDRYVNLQPAA